MRNPLKEISIPFKGYAYAAFGISVATLLAALIAQRFLPPIIPLFYGQPEGKGQLASSLALLLPGALSLAILVLNTGLSLAVKDDFLKKTLILTTLAISIFSLIATLKIIFLVGAF